MAPFKACMFLFAPLVYANIFGCCVEDSEEATTLISDGSMNDCDPNGIGDSLVYYCCNGEQRYCLSADDNCYWENYGCSSEYENIYCQFQSSDSGSPCGDDSNLMAYTNDGYYYCNNST